MPTLRQLAMDVGVMLGMDHDDAIRGEFALMSSAKACIDKLNDQVVSGAIKAGDDLSVADMVQVFAGITLTVNTAATTDDWDYLYFDLPQQVYSLPRDKGVAFISYNRLGLPPNCPPQVARAQFSATTITRLQGLYGSRIQKPAPNRPYFARFRTDVSGTITDRVYVAGVDPQAKYLIVGLYTTGGSTVVEIAQAADQEINLSPEYLRAVKKMMLDDEAWLLQIPQQRWVNDGRDLDPKEIVRVSRQLSLNDPANTTYLGPE